MNLVISGYIQSSLLFNARQDPTHFGPPRRGGRPNSVDHIIAVDNALKSGKKAHVFVDEKSFALRKAVHWAGLGNIVSLGPPSDELISEGGGGVAEKQEKKTEQDCKECKTRNLELNKYATLSIRPSMHVCVWVWVWVGVWVW